MDQLIGALVAGPTLLLAFLIFANINQVSGKVNRWFGSFILCVFIIQFNDLLEKTQFLNTRMPLNDFLGLADFIVAPLFYFSVVYFVKPGRRWRSRDYIHFAFAFIILLLFFLMLTVEQTPTAADKKNALIFNTVFNIIFCLQVIPYCILAYIAIDAYQKKLLLYTSNTDAINLKWLKQVVVCVLIMAAIWLADNVFKLARSSVFFDNVASLIYLAGTFFIAYFALKQKEATPLTVAENQEIDAIVNDTSSVYENNKKVLADDDLNTMKSVLLQLMDNNKLFLDPELSLFKLASELAISSHQLSYVINKGCDENFYQFVNRYRVEEAKKMIRDPKMEHLSLMGIAFEVGFNSKTVFNTTFKKITGQTPSEFKKSVPTL